MKPLILFVCTGNVCRSPMAVALFTAKAARMGEGERYRVASAGTWAPDDSLASEGARLALQRRGLALNHHRARTITPAMIDDAALILVMTRSHRDSLRAEFSSARAKIHLLSELVGQQYDIADPYGQSREEYEACATELASLIERGYARVAQWIAPPIPNTAAD